MRQTGWRSLTLTNPRAQLPALPTSFLPYGLHLSSLYLYTEQSRACPQMLGRPLQLEPGGLRELSIMAKITPVNLTGVSGQPGRKTSSPFYRWGN